MRKDQKIQGFTLIELLIVVAIIAILAAIAVPNFLEAQTRSKVSRCRSDMRSLATALESYRVDGNAYPPMSDVGFGVLTTDPGFHSRMPSRLTTPIAYMTSIPLDTFVEERTTFTSGTYPDSTDVGKRFVYYNYDLYIKEFPTSTGFKDRQARAGSWLFYGNGPDRDPFNRIPLTAPNQSVYINYDPTNGTISAGNIFRTQAEPEKYRN